MYFLFEMLTLAAPVVVIWLFWNRRASFRRQRQEASNTERDEALFRSMFPELLPHYHPSRLIHFVRARRRRKAIAGPWSHPPGFDAQSAETTLEGGKERVRLRNAAGGVLTEFFYEELAEGAALQVGEGQFTVDIRDAARPSVRYRHPEREFRWQRRHWTFQSRIADHPIESGDRSRFARLPGSRTAARGPGVATGADLEDSESAAFLSTAY